MDEEQQTQFQAALDAPLPWEKPTKPTEAVDQNEADAFGDFYAVFGGGSS